MTLLILTAAAIGYLVAGFTGAAVGVLVGIAAIPIVWAIWAGVTIAGVEQGNGQGEEQKREHEDADRVREYCKAHLFEPARARGAVIVSVRVCDVQAALGFTDRLPLVCSALGGTLIEQCAQVDRISLEGQWNDANAVFTFRLK